MRLKFQKAAGNINRSMDYGMNAVNASHKELDGVIKDILQGHASTQTKI